VGLPANWGIQRVVERIQRWLDRHTPGTGPCGARGASGNDGQKGHLTPLVSISELSSASGVAVAGLGVKLCGRSR